MKKSTFAMIDKASDAVSREFAKFWRSPMVVARLQTAPIVNVEAPIYNPQKATGKDDTPMPALPKPLKPYSTLPITPKEAGFPEDDG